MTTMPRFGLVKTLTLSGILCLLLAVPTRAGFERLDMSGRAVALGGAFTGLANSAYAVFYNPAGLSRLVMREASFFYSRPFGFSELSYFSVVYADPLLLPQGAGTIGVAARRYGFDLYNETTFSLAYSNALERKFFYGATLTYNSLAIQGYGSAAAVGIDVGAMMLVTPELSLGFAATNLNRPTVGEAQELLTQTYTLGASYRVLPNLRLLIDAEKDVRYPLSVKSGAEFEPVPYLSVRAGFSTEPSRITGGVGIHYAGVDLDYAIYTHQDLGLTHQLSVSLAFGGEVSAADKREEEERLVADAFDEAKPRLRDGELINLNTASLDDLMKLPGITKALATRILKYRDEYKRFAVPSEITRVKGIKKDLYRAIEKYLTVE